MTRQRHTALEQSLLNDYQRDFPLCPHPFAVLSEQLATDEHTVLDLFRRFGEEGVVTRIGPVFRPNTVGSSTLAAVSAPGARVEEVADTISACPEVNHNYEREHRFNLWFVVNAPTTSRRDAVLSGIASATGLEVMSLPLVRDYYIDLGFDIDFRGAGTPQRAASMPEHGGDERTTTMSGLPGEDLIPHLQAGLPLTHAPYAEIGSKVGFSEDAVLEYIGDLLFSGTIKRFGVVVRHHELGYRANAMCVWDIADEEVDALGRRIAQVPFVTLCYRRPRQLPHWPYNLFCMIHGKDRGTVLAQVQGIVDEFGLHHAAHDVLFSGRRFKQRGAYYQQHGSIVGGETAHVAHG